MKNNYQSKAVPRGTRTIWRYLSALILLFSLSIGQMWGAEIFSWTVSSAVAKDATVDATGGTVTCTGSAMGSETPSSSGYFKFNSSTQLTFTLSSGTFAAGDVISFNFTSGGNNKTVGVEIRETSPVTQLTETVATKGTSVTKTYTVAASDGIQGQNKFSIKRVDSNFSFKSVSVTRSSGGGGSDPVDPVFTYTPATYTIGDPALDLSTKLSSTNTTGAITFAVSTSDAGTTGASIASNKNFTATAAGTATITVSQEASTGYNAKSQDITVTVVEPDPCTTHHWFVATADATANGKTNWDGFTNAVTGSSGQTNSVTIDGTTYNLTKRTGSTGAGGTILGFTIPANKAGTLYGYMKSSGSAARILSLKKGDDVVKTNTEIVDGAWTLISIDAIAPGTYTLSPDQNVQVQMFVLKICDATFHTITLDLAGGTGETSISALDGAPATKPADPTKEHCAFDGWYNGASPYDWTANVSSNLTLTAHWTQLYTISFAAGEGSGDAPAAIADKANGETFTVPANTFTAPASKEFDKWNDGSADYAPGVTYTVGTANVVLTAQWKALQDKYTVIFKDGDVTLGTKQFDVASNPSDADIDKTKALSTFAAWQKEGVDIALDDAFWATVVKDATVTLTARWAKAYASNADFEAYIIANKSEKDDADKAEAYVKSLNYALSTKTGTTFDANDETNNGAYAGLKIKNAGTVLSWNVVAGKVVELKAGVMVANGSLAINSGTPATIDGGSTTSGNDNYKIHYFYSATEALYEFTTSNGSAEVIKAITMRDPYTVSFEAHGDADPSALPGQPSVTLPAATNGTASLLGWFDAETGGNKIGDAGDSYTPTANITLHAQWESVSTDARLASITLDPSTGVLEPAFDPEVVNYTYTMPYGTAAVPTITGATAVNANAKAPVIDAQAANWGDVAHIHGVAESDDTKDYYITMKMEPKDGISIIKVATTGGTNKTVTGVFAGDGDVNLSSSTKMDNGKYIGFTLDGTTLQAGDRINVHTTTAANTGGSHIIFYDNMTDKTELYETGEIGGVGDNIFEINAAMIGSATAYVYRSNADAAHQWNGYVDYIEVLRAMNPVLTAITIDGRDGVIDALDDKHFSVQIPYESDLAALTVVPTIVRNAAHPTTPEAVISNEGAWILGDNTYRIMDKDGDYTDYTITLDRDVLKHTVSFNTHGGSAVASVEVEDGEKLAAAPADPTKEDYIFQGWTETEDGDIVDVTSFTISADKEFHAVWVADGAIKLLDGSTVNHTNFITGVTADETVEFQGNTVNYAKFSGTVSGVNGVKDLTRVIAYNATTNKTKIQISAHNNSTSARNILVKGLVEGASAAEDLASIALGNKEDKVSDWIEFDNAANRTIYIMVSSSAGDVYFTQVKVIESGETPMKQAGEIGYSLNLNKGRFFGPKETDLAFEGLNAELSGDYTALNSGYAKLNATSMSFTVASDMTLSVTTNNNKTYYVTKDAAGTDNETAKAGVSEFDLTAGTWFITADVAEVQITNISFAAPKCEKPAIVDMSDVDLCDGDPYTALAVSASVSDGGTLHYAWFKEAGATDEAVGTDAASYTPDADGEYYVIVTNQKDGFADNTETSNAVTVQHLAGTTITTAPANVRKDEGEAATLTVVAAGKNLSYEWFTCNADGTGAEPLEPAATEASLDVTVPDGEQYYKVVVTGDCGTVEAIAKVEEWVELPQLDVTESTVWDWTYAGENNKLADGAGKNVDIVMANIRANDKIPTNDATFNSQALLFYGENVRNVESGRAYASIGHIKFNTTVPGVVIVEFSDNGSNNRRVSINGNLSESSASKTDVKTFSAIIPTAGEVEIMGVKEDGTGSNQYIRISKIEFVKVDYTREIRPGYFGTICLPNGGKMYGAALYEVAYFNGSDKIYFDEIVDGTMEPGMPYIFQSEGGSTALAVAYSEEAPAEAKNKNGLYGSYTQEELTPNAGNYVLLNNQYLFVDNTNVFVGANRAYIRLEDIPTTATAPAPGRRRVMMSVNSKNTPTGLEMINGQSQMTNKVLIDGQIYILRGEKMYDATGRLVK